MRFEKLEIDSCEKWKLIAPPMGGDKQWQDGRSAKELARYITKNLKTSRDFPSELSNAVSEISKSESEMSWYPEHITKFPSEYGQGEGRHHDMILFSDDLFIGIEAKADEPFDKCNLSEWLVAGNGKGSIKNRKKRADAMCNLIFGKPSDDFGEIKYQLLSAMTGVLLEAKERNIDTAALFVLVFKKKGHNTYGKNYYSEDKIKNNYDDLKKFLNAARYDEKTGKIVTNSNIKNVYVKYITIYVE